MIRKAACCCGACDIEVEGEPVLNGVCHCDNCKRRTGTAFGWSAYFPDERVTRRRGEMLRFELKHMAAERFFCSACGTTLFWRSETFMPGHTGIAGGCFAGDPLGPPNVTVTDTKRCAWLTLPGDWLASP